MTARMLIGGLGVVVSPLLPTPPTPGEEARRIVRHGLADVLEWLGEDIGPRPDHPTHAYQAGNTLFASRAFFEQLIVPGVSQVAHNALRNIGGGA